MKREKRMNKMEQNIQEQTTMKGTKYISWGYWKERNERILYLKPNEIIL